MKKTSIFIFIMFLGIGKLLSNRPITSNKSNLPWIKNIGQFDSNTTFLSKTFAADIAVKQDKSIHYILKNDISKPVILKEIFSNSFISSNKPSGVSLTKTKINYFKGNNYFSDIPTYQSIDLGEIWEGINITLRATNKNFEKIFILNPNANINDINVEIEGAIDICKDENDELQIDYNTDDIRFTKPIAWQDINGKIIDIPIRYKIKQSDNKLSYGFELGTYNSDYPIIVDPLLSSSYLGGSLLDYAKKIKIGKSGNIYIGGNTASYDFPVTAEAYDMSYNDSLDIFIAMFDEDLSKLEACTFIGGGKLDIFTDMVLDENDNIYFSGTSFSDDYPTIPGAFDTEFNDANKPPNSDMVITKLSSDLNTIEYSTFVGNVEADIAYGLEIDKDGNIVVMGISVNGISSVGPQLYPLTKEFVFFILNSELSEILASNSISDTLDSYNTFPKSICIDSSGNILITGITFDSDFPTTINCYSDTMQGTDDAFIIKLSSDVSTILACTYLGGKASDNSSSIIVDKSNRVYVTGKTYSSDFPYTPNSYDSLYNHTINNPLPDAFISILDSNLSVLEASTFFGGTNYDSGVDLKLDSFGNIYVTGITNSEDFPVFCNSYDKSHNGGKDCFIGKFNPNLSVLLTSTYIGGDKNDYTYAMDINETGYIYIAGSTQSLNFPNHSSPFPSYSGGNADGFVLKISAELEDSLPCCTELINPIANSSDNPRDIKIEWSDARGATGYYLSLGTTPDSNNILDKQDLGNITSYMVTDLSCSDSIFIKLQPYNNFGINNNCSQFWFKIADSFSKHEVYSLCDGDSIEWQGTFYDQTGEYYKNYTGINGCDSTYHLSLTVNDVYIYNATVDICQGGVYEWQDSIYSISGIFTKHFHTTNGCDSLFTLNLTVHPSYDIELDTSLCEGDTLFFNGQQLTDTGVYTTESATIYGCDSLVELTLTVHPSFAFSEEYSICRGDSFVWQDTIFTQPGTYYAYYQTTEGCDSNYQLNLNQKVDTYIYITGDTLYAVYNENAIYQWYTCPDFEIINDANEYFYIADSSGAYAVQIDINGCIDTSQCKNLIHTKTNNLISEFDLLIYPNPIHNNFTIQPIEVNHNYSIRLIDLRGNQVLEENKLTAEKIINVNRMEAGVYILSYRSEDIQIYKKIVILK